MSVIHCKSHNYDAKNQGYCTKLIQIFYIFIHKIIKNKTNKARQFTRTTNQQNLPENKHAHQL